jgi:hypothetical protein
MVLNGTDKVVITISGTATSRKLSFQAKGPSGAYGYVLAYKIGSTGNATVTCTTSEIGQTVWVIEGLKGYKELMIVIDAISGGNTTVKGQGVA